MAIVFDRYDPDSKRRWTVIDDLEVIKQLDNSRDLNVYFTCDKIVEDEITVPASKLLEFVAEPLGDEPTVKNQITKKDLMEAKRWLNSIGVPYNKMKNKETVVNLANEQGYELILESDNK